MILRSPTGREYLAMGVYMPAEPGKIVVRAIEPYGTWDRKPRAVHTTMLEDCPEIDFSKLMTEEQREMKRKRGWMIGNGDLPITHLKHISQCPIVVRMGQGLSTYWDTVQDYLESRQENRAQEETASAND